MGEGAEEVSSEALEILRSHVLITHARSGQAACAKERCDWGMKVASWKDRPIPSVVDGAHAEHQLELLEAIGFTQHPCTRNHWGPAPEDDSGW